MKDVPIGLMFYCFPLISIVARIGGRGQLNYDYFWVPALAFALGMFIPMELNIPLLVGGAINWYVTSRSNDSELNRARNDKGTLIASGFIAGGALMGVVSAALRFAGISFDYVAWWDNNWSEVISLIMYILIIVWMVRSTLNAKK